MIHDCHLNPYAARRILWGGDRALSSLPPLCCTYSQAADLIADNIANCLQGPTGNPPHDPFQRIKENWNASNLSDLRKVVKSPWLKGKTEQHLLDLYFEYFNNMIFGGGLNALRCTMTLQEPNAQQRARCVLGSTVDKRAEKDTTIHNVRCHISVFVRYPAPKTEAEAVVLLRNYLGTMLHEMVHAFFSIYVCKCNFSCRRKNLEFEESGMTGHGLHWLNASRSIERFVRYGLRMDLRLGREEALGLELVTADKDLWYVDLEKLGMDGEVVNREMDWYTHVFLEEKAEKERIEREKEEEMERLEQEMWEREEEEREAREAWEKGRPERDKKIKEARIRILQDLRVTSIRSHWQGLFKRISRKNPPPPPLSTPNFLLARRAPHTGRSKQAQAAHTSMRRSSYPYLQRNVNPNKNVHASDSVRHRIALEVRKRTYADLQSRTRDSLILREKHNDDPNAQKRKKVVSSKALKVVAKASVLDLQKFWNLDETAKVLKGLL
ncbi:hypothetical protein NHQ30_002759 [Ciborinia camelliae]|nr:hypothetical protein NHQ30_002759 [Ciborinia camelliae]